MPSSSRALGDRLALRLQAAWDGRGLLSTLLAPAGWLVGLLARLRRLAHAHGFTAHERLDVPVVVVGNWVAGGAGKTPVTLALVQALLAAGHRPGIVSRGHGRGGDGVLEVTPATDVADAGDEPLLLRRRAGVPVVVGRDRVAAGRALRRAHPDVTVVVCDDGLQHLRLARDAEVVVFDERGGGNGRCLPAGPLREPLPRDAPPGVVVVYNAPAPTMTWPGHLMRRRLAGAVPLDAWHRGEPATPAALHALRGRDLLAVAGTARPSRFFAMLRDEGLVPRECPLPDHAPLDVLPWPADTADVVVTEKDAVKLRPGSVGATRVWVAPLDSSLPAATVDAVLRRLAAAGPRPPT